MASWKAAYLNELSLLWYRKKLLVFGVCSALLPIILALSIHALQPILGLLSVSQAFPIQMLSIYTGLWIPLFMVTMIGDVFPNEYASRTMKLSLLRPTSRFQLFASKIAALATTIAALLLLLSIVTSICQLFSSPSQAFINHWGIIKAYVAAFISMTALSALFVCAAQFFKSPGGYITFAVLFYTIAKFTPFLFSAFSAFSPTAYTDWHMLWLSTTISGFKLLTTTLFLIASCLLFFTLGYYKFDRQEF